MKKVLFGLLLISTVLSPANAKANSSNQIQGKQYIVLGGGARPIADNTIFYRSCNYKDECENFELSYRQAIAQESDDLAILRRIGTILDALKEAGSTKVATTDFDGNYSFKCPTSKCLVFSMGNAGLAHGYWLKTVKANSRVDLTGSNAIHLYNSRN